MSDMYRDSIFWVEVERIKPNPFQPRREFDEQKLAELADSIRMYGLLQPLTVTRREEAQEDGGIRVEYELIAGERRLRASRIAGLAQVPVIIRASEDDDKMKFELAIIENLQREDLNPIDRALAFDKLARDFQYSWAEVGRRVGRSREYVSNSVRLLSLPQHVQDHLVRGDLTEGHTRPLLMLNDKTEAQEELLHEIVHRKMNVRDSEMFARRAAQDKVTKRHKVDPLIISLEKQLSEKLGTRVHIEPKEVGGKLVINYFSASDLDTLLTAVQVEQQGIGQAAIFNGDPRLAKEAKTKEETKSESAGEDIESVASEPEADETPHVPVQSDPKVLPDDAYPMPESTTAVSAEANEEENVSAHDESSYENAVPEHYTKSENLHESHTEDSSEVQEENKEQYEKPEDSPVAQTSTERRNDSEDELYSIRNFTV